MVSLSLSLQIRSAAFSRVLRALPSYSTKHVFFLSLSPPFSPFWIYVVLNTSSDCIYAHLKGVYKYISLSTS